MKERPILFSAPMIQAILAGSKTQTRRVIKPPIDPSPFSSDAAIGIVRWRGMICTVEEVANKCRYGALGDRIWVKEGVRITGRSTNGFRCNYVTSPSAEGDYMGRFFRWEEFPHKVPQEGKTFGRAMPKVLARIWLEITSVRVERLNDISEADAIAEGIPDSGVSAKLVSTPIGLMAIGKKPCRAAYELLWESINDAGSWALNPWVFVINFKPLPSTEGK